MRLRGLFFTFSLIILIVLGILGYLSAGYSAVMFFIVEGLVLLATIFLFTFYQKIIKPLHIIESGMELLMEQDFSSRLSKVGESEADRIVMVFNRMMEQLKNERLRLREQNHFLDLLIEASPVGVIIASLNGEVTRMNPVALRITGLPRTEVEGKKLSEITAPLPTELARIPRNESKTIRLNDANIYKCVHSSFINQGFPQSFYLVESLTEEVVKAEKKAYEKVIRMIAHEVNNTTAGIISSMDIISETLCDIENTEDIIEVMRICVERCHTMSRFITRFADVVKIPEPHPSPVNPNELAFACKRFMEGWCRDRNISILLETEYVPEIKLDASLFEQVLVNIIKNSAESIESDGEIIIRTTAAPSIEIIDNGKGISAETEEKLFTPFFSTKPHGQGLGLIFIRDVLARHNCTFSLRTYADGLTRFRIMLPKR